MKRTYLKRESKSERSKLIKKCDDIFRKIIRLRDNMTCQRTGKKDNLQVAHFFTRSILSLRWDEENACLLQRGIHYYWAHVKHEEFRDFWISRIGKERFEMLKIKSRFIMTLPTYQLKNIKLALEMRLKELCKKENEKL